MIGLLVGWCVGGLGGWLVGWLVGWVVGGLAPKLVQKSTKTVPKWSKNLFKMVRKWSHMGVTGVSPGRKLVKSQLNGNSFASAVKGFRAKSHPKASQMASKMEPKSKNIE